ESDSLLFQPDGRAVTVLDEISIDSGFLGGEVWQDGVGGGVLRGQLVPVGEQGPSVHENRTSRHEASAKAIEDGIAVCVDVAPVHDLLVGEPRDELKSRDRKASTEHDKRVWNLREGEVTVLVLHDEDRCHV